jgi:hypothetical protein
VREPGIVTLALVELRERLERGVVSGILGQHLLVELDRAARVDLPLAIGLRHLLEDADPLDRVVRRGELVLEARDELLPHLRACGQPAQRLGDLRALGLELGDPLPRLERALDVPHAELGELRDLLEAVDEVFGRRSRLARVVERELVEIDQAAPVAALAEVIDVACERFLVHRVDAERLVQQLGGAVAIAHVLARDRRELEDLGDQHLGGRVGVLAERVDLGLHQARQAFPVLILVEELAQLERRLAARLLVGDELGQHVDQARAIGQLRSVQRGAAAQDLGALGGILDDVGAVAQDPIELGPLRAARQRLLQRLGARLRVRVDADGAAQVVEAGLIVARRHPAAAEIDEQLARLVAGLPVAEPGARVDVGELLRDLERRRVELARLLEVVRGGLEVLGAQRELAELEADGRPARACSAIGREHVELGLIQLGDHRVVAEGLVELARGIERFGPLRLELPRLLPVPQRAIDPAEVVVPQLGGLAVMRGAALRDLGLALRPISPGELGELELDDLDGVGRIAGLDDLEQAIRGAIVGRIELEGGVEILDRGRGLAEDDHRLASLGPRIGRPHRIALVLRPGRAQLGEQLATAGVA